MLSSFAPKSSRSVLFCYRKLKCKDQRVTALVSEIKLIFKTALRFIRSFGHACTRHLAHYFQLGAIIDYGSCFSGKKLRMEISIDADVLGCFQHKYVYIAARSINYLFHVNFQAMTFPTQYDKYKVIKRFKIDCHDHGVT